MSNVRIKAEMEWKCPYCKAAGTGKISMNGLLMDWLDKAWKEHIRACNPNHPADA